MFIIPPDTNTFNLNNLGLDTLDLNVFVNVFIFLYFIITRYSCYSNDVLLFFLIFFLNCSLNGFLFTLFVVAYDKKVFSVDLVFFLHL